MNSIDLLEFFNVKLDEVLDQNNNNALLSMFHSICGKLKLEKVLIYSKFMIPINSVCSFRKQDYSVVLLNNFDTRSLKEQKQNYTKYFSRLISETCILLKCVVKIRSDYAIVTIERHKIQPVFTIHLYIPRTRRRYVSELYQNDILRWEFNFMQLITGVDQEMMKKLENEASNYEEFSNFYIKSSMQITQNNKASFTNYYSHLQSGDGIELDQFSNNLQNQVNFHI